ncbi:accessory factor UbiK family protein [Oligella urethralis]|uniref:accessory factor UbiK family protein n=1 Tax=Oligella urethralis TaxID=90245 RepID=UPI0027B9A707|nr:accessory factor UbiK family protein [Oligella urethralis]
MKAQSFFEEFQKGIQDLIAKSPAADIEKNVKAFMAQGFSRLDLVTREEFDVQVAMVEKLRQRITALEALLAERDQQENKTSPTED